MIDFEFEETEGGVLIHFKKCVPFANGKALKTPAHHHSVHTGNAGGSPFAQGALYNAGNLVVPLAPLTPLEGCVDSPLFFPGGE